MNRNSPKTDELRETIKGICKKNETVLETMERMKMVESLSKAYLKLYELAKEKNNSEFFGLRDFYSLIKMIYWHIKNNHKTDIEWSFFERAIRRCFGGLADVDPIKAFVDQFNEDKLTISIKLEIKSNVIDLIKEAKSINVQYTEEENRYLLLCTQNDNALEMINNFIFNQAQQGKLLSRPK